MVRYASLAIALTAVSASPANAREYLTEVVSEVYQTAGSPAEIAARAQTCIAQHLAPGTVNAPLIITSDIEGGMIVARSAITYGSLPKWQIRSRFTFEAREGRFRISQTNLERFNEYAGGWAPIGKWTGSQWKKAEQAYIASANSVAACVLADRSNKDDW
ncbi:hypothetical protein [Qipengyuania oceanensis]|uniref:Uncharacterized protein n=1 Tax=Qipengyuania oceanensis TaxID=1463597 RepID=A0A844YJ27_9SPHN|nr:hypothetical protein [Qipengyuania oceanensis]MXO63947.1 hypothetical protein [Qipengyuania oceanensis]